MGACKYCQAKINGWSDKPTEDNQVWEINIVADKPKISKKNHTTKRHCKGVERLEISQNFT